MKAEKALLESEERFRRFSDITTEGILINDRGTILDVNDAFVRIFGYSMEELIGSNGFELIAPESLEKVKDIVLTKKEGVYEARRQVGCLSKLAQKAAPGELLRLPLG